MEFPAKSISISTEEKFLIATGGGSRIIALALNGNELWKDQRAGMQTESAAISGNGKYIYAHMGMYLYCYSNDGTLFWMSRLKNQPKKDRACGVAVNHDGTICVLRTQSEAIIYKNWRVACRIPHGWIGMTHEFSVDPHRGPVLIQEVQGMLSFLSTEGFHLHDLQGNRLLFLPSRKTFEYAIHEPSGRVILHTASGFLQNMLSVHDFTGKELYSKKFEFTTKIAVGLKWIVICTDEGSKEIEFLTKKLRRGWKAGRSMYSMDMRIIAGADHTLVSNGRKLTIIDNQTRTFTESTYPDKIKQVVLSPSESYIVIAFEKNICVLRKDVNTRGDQSAGFYGY